MNSIGFESIDLATIDRSVLASITGNGPRVGKYFVNLRACGFAAERLRNAAINSDIIICDEIGPMEIKSGEFLDSVGNSLNVDKKVVSVVHQKLKHVVIDQFTYRSSYLRNLSLENRDKVNEILF